LRIGGKLNKSSLFYGSAGKFNGAPDPEKCGSSVLRVLGSYDGISEVIPAARQQEHEAQGNS